MKAFVHTIATILLLDSCCTNPANGNGISSNIISPHSLDFSRDKCYICTYGT